MRSCAPKHSSAASGDSLAGIPTFPTRSRKHFGSMPSMDRRRCATGNRAQAGTQSSKERLPLHGAGKRGGARLIVYCDDERVVALFVYVKSATELIPEKAIRKALEAAGIGS